MPEKPKARGPYDPGPEPVCDCSNSPSRTKQEFSKEADINQIMARYVRTRQFPPDALEKRNAQYADFSEIGSFHELQTKIVEAQQNFMQLPAEMRTRFDNDPGKLLDFVSDEDNRKEGQDLGIINPDPDPPKAEDKPPDPAQQPPEAKHEQDPTD